MINNITTTSEHVILLSGSMISEISNCSIIDINKTACHILKSTITLINNMRVENAISGLYIEQSQIGMIQNSKMLNCGSNSFINGGAMLIENSNSTISNVTFDQNVAKIGGAVHIK